ncbi:type VI secretion system Vgr family protein [Pseudomonas sp. Pseu.R1]|uniref:type VI secretion system Vgr family protein n=1 Tax=Pseudomonas sp. Pseu.R1 TaxID=3379818 RepID=UPI003B937731
MHDNSHVTLTLAIADSSYDLQVVGVSGHDRLNAPFRFEVDLVSTEARLTDASLLHRSAYLQISNQAEDVHGLHGQIHELRHLYQGQDLSLYRLTLMPSLQRLANPTRRRVFRDLNVIEIIERVLQGHDMPGCTVRFDHVVGVYPPREQCLQYDEHDLHFLDRLCEEEGISYRFEHSPRGHTLVFSDDPMTFPEWPAAAGMAHLAERLSARNCYSSHAGEHYVPLSSWSSSASEADNQPFWAPYGETLPPGRLQQIRSRTLERLRCERRDIKGNSAQPWLRGGLVIRVDDHPEPQFNDHWLLTDVSHTAWELAPLRGCASCDVVHILQAMAFRDTGGNGVSRLLAPDAKGGKPPLAHYDNQFQVIPWTLPFRPTLAHLKPVLLDEEYATRLSGPADRSGRIPVRFDWETDETSPGCLVRTVTGLMPHQEGTRLKIGFFEGDPEQPVVVGTLDNEPDNDTPVPRDTAKSLCIDSQSPLLLKGAHATLSITEDGVHYLPQAAVNDA